MNPTFTVVSATSHRKTLIDLNVEYMSWVSSELNRSLGISLETENGMPIADYASHVLDKICGERPPRGIFYLASIDDQIAGMGGVRSIGKDIAEMKRVYVRPEYRGQGVGSLLVRRLLGDALAFGYRRVCLDSAPFQQSAHRIYEAAGFRECKPYPGCEVPTSLHSVWRFMEIYL
jgi:GNAT superfamily N-acetyltransferase